AEARSRRRWSSVVEVRSIVPPADLEDLDQVAIRDQLDRGFRRLPLEQRAVVVFHYYMGLTFVEIADQLGISVGTVKSRMHAATSSLRAALDADARVPESTERLA